MTVSIENVDTLLLLCGNQAEQLVCQFRAAHSRYIATSSTEEVCGAKDLKVFGDYSGCQGSDTVLLVVLGGLVVLG
jgi:hypothetical protein